LSLLPHITGAAQWTQLPAEQRLRSIDFKDTFLDAQHLQDSFPQYSVTFNTAPGQEAPVPPFRITLPDEVPPPLSTQGENSTSSKAGGEAEGGEAAADGKGHTAGVNGTASGPKPSLVVESYTPPDPGPYPQDAPRKNNVRFTPVQVEAIMAGE
jgi:intron-binding protein aquarius